MTNSTTSIRREAALRIKGDARAIKGVAEYRPREYDAARRTLSESVGGDGTPHRLTGSARVLRALSAEDACGAGGALERYPLLDLTEGTAYLLDVLMSPEQLAARITSHTHSAHLYEFNYAHGVSRPRATSQTHTLRRNFCIVASLFLVCLAQLGCGGTATSEARTTPVVKTTEARSGGESVAATSRTANASTATAAAVVASVDSDDDGIPDRAELRSYGDRENFRRWFTALAETQFYEVSKQWNAEQRDCAGLVRFSWREALRTHDRAWMRRMGGAYEAVAPDVQRASTLERGALGERIFRTRPGAFQESDLADDTFSDFADARTLKEFNAEFVSRDRRRAESGDLMFFHQPWAQRYPYHVMIFLGGARVEPEGASDWVVYHTGVSADDRGTIKKVRLTVLDEHPDRRWRPVESNRNFLGFYRLKILR